MVITAGPPDSRLRAARHISAADSGGSRDMSFTISPNGRRQRTLPRSGIADVRRGGGQRRPARAHRDPPRPPMLRRRRGPRSSRRVRRPGPEPWSHGRRVSGTCRWLPRACAGLGTPYARVLRRRCSSACAARLSRTSDTPTKACVPESSTETTWPGLSRSTVKPCPSKWDPTRTSTSLAPYGASPCGPAIVQSVLRHCTANVRRGSRVDSVDADPCEIASPPPAVREHGQAQDAGRTWGVCRNASVRPHPGVAPETIVRAESALVTSARGSTCRTSESAGFRKRG